MESQEGVPRGQPSFSLLALEPRVDRVSGLGVGGADVPRVNVLVREVVMILAALRLLRLVGVGVGVLVESRPGRRVVVAALDGMKSNRLAVVLHAVSQERLLDLRGLRKINICKF